MDEDILRGIQTVEYYYEQYKDGDEEALVALEEIAKGIKRNAKARIKYHLIYSVLNFVQKMKVSLIDIEMLKDPNYQELIGFCQEDIEYYTYIGVLLQGFVEQALRTDNYDNLDDAFILSVKMSMILHNITEYYKEINTMLEFVDSPITYVGTTNRVKKLKEETRIEIEALTKSLRYDEEKNF